MCFYSSNNARALALAKRYGLKTDIVEIAREILEEQRRYRTNAFTHPSCPIVTENNHLEIAQWGIIPHWTKSAEDAQKIRKMTLNARAETVCSLLSFRIPIATKRCLFPVTGYFEFHHQSKSVIPYYLFLKHEEIFSLGGMFERWRNPVTNEETQTFTVITVPANELCTRIHNGGKTPFRMPLIISREDEGHWLDHSIETSDIIKMFRPFNTSEMDAYPIAQDFLKKPPNDPDIIKRAA